MQTILICKDRLFASAFRQKWLEMRANNGGRKSIHAATGLLLLDAIRASHKSGGYLLLQQLSAHLLSWR